MDLQNFIYLLFAAVWLSGLIWGSVIAFYSKMTKELAELLNVKVETISFYGTPAYKKRTNLNKVRRLVVLD